MTEAAVLTLPVPEPVDEDVPLPPLADPLRGMTGRQKAAVLVLQLGREASSRVLGELSEAELEELSTEIARIGSVPADVSAAVLGEFAAYLASGASTTRGGLDLARELLLAAVGEKRAEEILDRLSQTFVELPFAFIQSLDSRQVVSFLSDEHPQTIALVLAHLPAGQASAVLTGLGPELQADVAHRIAVMDRTSPELIRQVESSLERRLSSLGVAGDLSAVGGLRPLVEIINRADRNTERMILEGLEERDPELAEQVRSQMFMFEDLVSLDDRAIQLVLRQVQVSDIATALKGVPDGVRNRIVQNMSERAALNLAEEIEVLGPVRVHVVEEAQAGIVRVIRQLEESGQIVVGRGDEDAFVA
ncbi:MAG: flagellar motor switch protein FliG [Pseudonocardiales bacterium]|jgi:flagellar motor switch protein FliG|nr:flagellar motor switch protein FliG [Pseudonocardiales bacterium]MDT4943599.1 flagellar motor switch protein FliG [Pseudonocardiales bacterium]